ncbi:hypothetical protein Tco_0814784 [Tanacetum coccineum]
MTPELLVGPTFELMKGSCKSLVELEYFFEEVYKATTDQLDWNNPKGQQYPHDLRKPLPLIPNSRGVDVYSKRIIIDVTKLQIVEWHNYKHLDWITVHRDDDKMYTFKEGNFNRLRIQDIEDMPLLLVQGELTNLTVEERLAFNVSLGFHLPEQREDMLLLLVQGKLTNLTVEERLAFNVSLRSSKRNSDEVSASDYLERK